MGATVDGTGRGLESGTGYGELQIVEPVRQASRQVRIQEKKMGSRGGGVQSASLLLRFLRIRSV